MRNNNLLKQQATNRLLILVLMLVISVLVSGCGQESPPVYRVGILSGFDFFLPTIDGFKTKMTELGYVEGENITYDVQQTDFDPVKYRQALDKFVEEKVDLILVYPTEASLEAKAATQGTDIPVLFTNANIEGLDLVDSIRQPGGNITGVRYPGPDMSAKRVEIFQEIVPQAKRIWVPYLKDYPIVPSQLEAMYPAAEMAGITLIEVPVANFADLEATLVERANADDSGLDGILLIDEPLGGSPDAFAVTGKFAAEHQIPIGGVLQSTEDYASVFGITIDSIEVGQQAATLADKIFKGIQAGTIPVVSAESYIHLNYKAAQELGLSVPKGLLSQAREIIR